MRLVSLSSPLLYTTSLPNTSHSNNSKEDVDAYRALLEACIRSTSLVKEESLVRTYCACGEIGLACDVFDEIPQPSVFLWNALIRAYSWSGDHLDKAIELYYQMVDLGVRAKQVHVPSRSQSVREYMLALEKGVDINDHARRVGRLDSDLFVSTALINMYMKCGCLDDSHQLFDKMFLAYALDHGFHSKTINFVLEMERLLVEIRTSFVLHNVEEEEKEHALNSLSQRETGDSVRNRRLDERISDHLYHEKPARLRRLSPGNK